MADDGAFPRLVLKGLAWTALAVGATLALFWVAAARSLRPVYLYDSWAYLVPMLMLLVAVLFGLVGFALAEAAEANRGGGGDG